LENGSSRHPHVLRTADTTRTHYVSEVGQGSQLILCSVKLKSSSKVPVASCLPQHQDVAMGNGLRVGLWGKGLKNRHWQDRKLRVPRNGLPLTDGVMVHPWQRVSLLQPRGLSPHSHFSGQGCHCHLHSRGGQPQKKCVAPLTHFPCQGFWNRDSVLGNQKI
jgi:hypothetical protein